MGVMYALSCEIFVKCQLLCADVTLNYCEQKIISLWGSHKHGGTPALPLKIPLLGRKKTCGRGQQVSMKRDWKFLKKLHGEKSELMM